MTREKEGPIEPQGEQGVTGKKGETGTANVIYSEWTKVTFSHTADSYVGEMIVPTLTREILDNGQIELYVKKWRADDYYIYQNLNNLSAWSGTWLSIGKIRIFSHTNLGSSLFRYVIIPHSIVASARANGVDFSSFEAVAKTFNITD